MHLEPKAPKLLKTIYGHDVSMDEYLHNKGMQLNIKKILDSTHQDLSECDRRLLNRQVTVIFASVLQITGGSVLR